MPHPKSCNPLVVHYSDGSIGKTYQSAVVFKVPITTQRQKQCPSWSTEVAHMEHTEHKLIVTVDLFVCLLAIQKANYHPSQSQSQRERSSTKKSIASANVKGQKRREREKSRSSWPIIIINGGSTAVTNASTGSTSLHANGWLSEHSMSSCTVFPSPHIFPLLLL